MHKLQEIVVVLLVQLTAQLTKDIRVNNIPGTGLSLLIPAIPSNYSLDINGIPGTGLSSAIHVL